MVWTVAHGEELLQLLVMLRGQFFCALDLVVGNWIVRMNTAS